MRLAKFESGDIIENTRGTVEIDHYKVRAWGSTTVVCGGIKIAKVVSEVRVQMSVDYLAWVFLVVPIPLTKTQDFVGTPGFDGVVRWDYL
jgi:hypothetical protein